MKELGGRDAIVKKIVELKGQPKDHEYADKLRRMYEADGEPAT